MTTLRRVLFNQYVIGIPFSMCVYFMMSLRGCEMSGELPTFPWVMVEVLFHTLVEEVFFYYSHRYVSHTEVHMAEW